MKNIDYSLLKFKIRYFYKIFKNTCKIICYIFILILIYCLVFKKKFLLQKQFDYIKNLTINFTTQLEKDKCQNLYLDGIKYSDVNNIKTTIKQYCNNEINITTLKETLLNENWIKHLFIQQKIPNILKISIIEYNPFALYLDNKDEIKLVDEQGNFILINKDQLYLFKNLLVITGEPTSKDIYNIYNMLTIFTNISNKTKQLNRIGGRRWDLLLNNGIIVKLPEENDKMFEIWKNLDNVLSKNSIENELEAIDLRIKDKIYLKFKE